jgi:hypothetical protein
VLQQSFEVDVIRKVEIDEVRLSDLSPKPYARGWWLFMRSKTWIFAK